MTRFTNEQIVTAYKETGSVWKAAKLLGACGQSVWERLTVLGYRLSGSQWTEDEVAELRSLASECTIGEAARRLGRTYAGVACKISELGIGTRYGNNVRQKVRRGSGLNKVTVARLTKELSAWSGTLRPFCRQRGLDVESLVLALQKYEPLFWQKYVTSHSDLKPKTCPNCYAEFIPMNGKQQTCSRKCSSLRRTDRQYFGGKRSLAIGMDEGICQLCEKERSRLAAHHIFGKQNDPENDFLIALCNGCHSLVGSLGVRADVESESFWENLVSLALLRKLGHRKPMGFHVCVDIDELTQEDLEYELDCAAST